MMRADAADQNRLIAERRADGMMATRLPSGDVVAPFAPVAPRPLDFNEQPKLDAAIARWSSLAQRGAVPTPAAFPMT